MKFLEFCFKNKSTITVLLVIIGCGIILMDWKLISHEYPNRREWIVSFISLGLIHFVNAIEETKDDDDNFVDIMEKHADKNYVKKFLQKVSDGEIKFKEQKVKQKMAMA